MINSTSLLADALGVDGFDDLTIPEIITDPIKLQPICPDTKLDYNSNYKTEGEFCTDFEDSSPGSQGFSADHAQWLSPDVFRVGDTDNTCSDLLEITSQGDQGDHGQGQRDQDQRDQEQTGQGQTGQEGTQNGSGGQRHSSTSYPANNLLLDTMAYGTTMTSTSYGTGSFSYSTGIACSQQTYDIGSATYDTGTTSYDTDIPKTCYEQSLEISDYSSSAESNSDHQYNSNSSLPTTIAEDGETVANIKQNLKDKIRLRRESEGAGDFPTYELFEPPKQYQLTAEEEEKNEIRKARNRKSATRSRLKRIEREKKLEKEFEEEEERNSKLQSEIKECRNTLASLRQYVNKLKCGCLKHAVPNVTHKRKGRAAVQNHTGVKRRKLSSSDNGLQSKLPAYSDAMLCNSVSPVVSGDGPVVSCSPPAVTVSVETVGPQMATGLVTSDSSTDRLPGLAIPPSSHGTQLPGQKDQFPGQNNQFTGQNTQLSGQNAQLPRQSVTNRCSDRSLSKEEHIDLIKNTLLDGFKPS